LLSAIIYAEAFFISSPELTLQPTYFQKQSLTSSFAGKSLFCRFFPVMGKLAHDRKIEPFASEKVSCPCQGLVSWIMENKKSPLEKSGEW